MRFFNIAFFSIKIKNYRMYIKGAWICDEEGRSLILRGCNLGGSTKVPVVEDISAGTVSFVGKPFLLEDADERFAELKRWGFYFNRLIVPWEALEHEGPGKYDEAYLAYLRKLLLSAEKHGIYMWIDPHQDVWSRTAGGDGAPAWTLEALGIDTGLLEAAGAVLSKEITGITTPDRRPLMTWPAGNNRYAAATMFTLFFAGNAFAPSVKPATVIAGSDANTPIQNWLQTRFIEAYAHAKRRLKNCASIAGWGTMNEPHPGFIGYSNLNNLENNMVAVGPMPSPFAAMAAASGHKMEIPVYSTGVFGVRKKGRYLLNPNGVSVFKNGNTCPWKLSGVWGDGEHGPTLLNPYHFSGYMGKPPRFSDDFLVPFMDKFRQRLAETDEKSLFFIEGVPKGIGIKEDAAAKESIKQHNTTSPRNVHGFHWYDGPTMFLKQFRSWFNVNTKNGKIVLGKKAVAALFVEQIAGNIVPDMPNLVGEFGLPFDIYKGKAFTNGNYSAHEEALTMYYDAMDQLLLGACIWDYSADNTNSCGDFWNNEDFSIVTTGDGKGPPRPRATAGWLRPYPLATAGEPLSFKWNAKKKTLYFRYRPDPGLEVPTMIFVPDGIWDSPKICAAPAVQTGTEDSRKIQAEYNPEVHFLFVHHNGFEGEIEVRIQ
ncbi:MAG: cellulase family glycosylhydrolase [Treponema sp.]|nr:cellulase family glycosylhydrolase [Treponema sp.]